MGAIYGIQKFNNKKVSAEELKELATNIFRQPYDKENFITNNNIGLGNKLFYTTPESFSEILPSYDKNKIYFYTADVRIDNRDELIKKLNFNIENLNNRTITDTDLIIAAYEKWGEQCVDFLIGDFVFVIWDKKLQKLICVRDRLGVKPFFYYILNDTFVFASEVYALTNSFGFNKEPNLESMKSHLHYFGLRGYSETMYKHVYSLPPGSIMTIQNKKQNIRRYWYPEKIKVKNSLELPNAREEFLSLLKEAVKCRLRSAFSIGFELSGGLDSSSIVCLADKIKTEQEKFSFSCIYKNYRCDEKKFIDKVKTQIKNFTFEANKIDYKKTYNMEFNYTMSPEWPIYLPTTDSFPFTEMIQKSGVRVVLTGEGGDQIAQGSEYQIIDYLIHFNLIQFYQELKNNNFSKGYIKRFLISPMLTKNMKRFIKSFRLKKDAKQKKTNIDEIKDIFEFTDFKFKAFYDDLTNIAGILHTSWSDHNIYHFRSIYGVEFRHPFLDSRLIEFTLALPAKYKLNNNITKVVLREAMRGILPEDIRTRNDKAEFSEVLIDQLKAMDLSILEDDLYIVDIGIIKKDEVQEYLKSFKAMEGGVDPSLISKVWRVVNLEYWYRKNFVK